MTLEFSIPGGGMAEGLQRQSCGPIQMPNSLWSGRVCEESQRLGLNDALISFSLQAFTAAGALCGLLPHPFSTLPPCHPQL